MSRTTRRKGSYFLTSAYKREYHSSRYFGGEDEFNTWIRKVTHDTPPNWSHRKDIKGHTTFLRRRDFKNQLAKFNKLVDYEDADFYDRKKRHKLLRWVYD